MKSVLIAGISGSILLSACGGGSTATDSTPELTPVAVNQAPRVSLANIDQSAIVGVAFTYDATRSGGAFTDTDGDAMTYSVTYSPTGNGLSDTAGVISGTPLEAGTFTVTIIADDGNGGSASDSFNIVVGSADTVQTGVEAKFGGRIDVNNLEDYAGQTVPNYITKLNTGGNPITNEGATLGRVLFYDPALSIDDTISCSSCHTQSHGFNDPEVVSTGVEGGQTGRHSMRIVNTQFANERNFFWDERANTHEQQESEPLKDVNEHGFSGIGGRPGIAALEAKLEALDYYQELFTLVYGDPAVTEDRMELALAQFTKSIWSFDSKFDAGRTQVNSDEADFPNFTADENAGKTLFFDGQNNGGANCDTCHIAPEFDIRVNSGHNGVVGVANAPGEFDFTNTRSPSLRDVANPDGEPNGPFMHDGSLPTLLDVVNHYDNVAVPDGAAARQEFLNTIDNRLTDGNVGQDLDLSEAQKQQLVAFLNTLSGSNIYTNEKHSDPF